MVMKHAGGRFVPARPSIGEDLIPELGILSTSAEYTRAETRIEPIAKIEGTSSNRHVRARANFPYRSGSPPRGGQIAGIEVSPSIALMEEVKIVLKNLLRLRFELSGKYESRNHHHRRVFETAAETRGPIRMNNHIVIRECDQFIARGCHGGIAGRAQPRLRLVAIAHARKPGDDLERVVGLRRVIDHQNLVRRLGRRNDRRKASFQFLRSLVRTHSHRQPIARFRSECWKIHGQTRDRALDVEECVQRRDWILNRGRRRSGQSRSESVFENVISGGGGNRLCRDCGHLRTIQRELRGREPAMPERSSLPEKHHAHSVVARLAGKFGHASAEIE
jgi:hypothetical protein